MANPMTITKAYLFAQVAHKGQVRKYTGEPYITHPVHVASILTKYCPDVSSKMMCAALLHDVVEDCDVSLEDIKTLFGEEIKPDLGLYFWAFQSRAGNWFLNDQAQTESTATERQKDWHYKDKKKVLKLEI